MASLSCKEKTMLVTTSHVEETVGSSGQRYFDLRALRDNDLADRFREACKKLEGLMYAALGSVPASYADGKQWWESEYPRCLWPEQAFVYSFGGPNPPTGEYGSWYYLPGCNGRVGTLAKTGSVPIGSTGYFDWSRSDTITRQYRRLNHNTAFFPAGSVERTCAAGEYDDPMPNEPVTITYRVPADVQSRVGAVTLYYQIGSGGLASLAMTSDDGGQTYTAEIAGQDDGTPVLFYLQVVTTDETPLTMYEPCGASSDTPPTLAAIPDDPSDSPPGWGHNLQAQGTSYYYRVFEHRHQYAAGFPELIWEDYSGAKAAGLKRCTGTWQFKPWTTIKPALINLCRFMLDYLGSKFHHHPARRGSHGSCCIFLPIIWRWSGSARPWHYKTGGKGGDDEVRPLHNNPDEANVGSLDARRTWRGAPGLFQTYMDNMANYHEALEYADDESWRSWPLGAAYLYKETGPWAPGGFRSHGSDRGLKEGDVIDRVHLLEIIAAVDYLIENGLWYHDVVPTCKRTPTSCFPWSGDYGREMRYQSDRPDLCYDVVTCFDTCQRGECITGEEPIVPYNAPASGAACRAGEGEGVEPGFCTKHIYWASGFSPNCGDPNGPVMGRMARCKSAYPGVACDMYGEECGDEWCFDCDFPYRSGSRYGSSCGWSAFVCGPPRWFDAVGSETYPSGNPMWTAIDVDHGNGAAKVRAGSRTDPNWGDHRGPQYPKPMGNSSSQAYACHEGTDGSTHVQAVAFDSVTPVETAGWCIPWATPRWLSTECDYFDDPEAVVPPLPGVGLHGVNPDGSRYPLCHYERQETDHELCEPGYSRVECSYAGHYPEACRVGGVWKNVDLNLNANGVPQLRDYKLNIRMLQDGGGEYDPPRYPDTVYNNCGTQCVDTYGRVFCPFDTWL